MKNRKISKGICVLLLAVVLISSIGTAANVKIKNEIKIQPTISIAQEAGYCEGARRGDIVWDNNMDYIGLIASQYDETAAFEPIVADDFQFAEETEVEEVHWVGGYWNLNYTQGDFDWNITFYTDRGDGCAPGPIIAGPYTYTQEQCNPELLNDTGSTIFYKFSVDLPSILIFLPGHKFWISFQGIGLLLPQSGVGYHQDPINLNQGVFKSVYFGYPEWTNLSDLLGLASDLCFQLTAPDEDNTNPTVEIIKPVKGIYLFNKKILPRFFGLPLIIGAITVEVNATDNVGIEKVEFYGGLLGKTLLGNSTTEPYNFTWKRGRMRLIHIHKLTVIAYDFAGNTASDSILVRKFL